MEQGLPAEDLFGRGGQFWRKIFFLGTLRARNRVTFSQRTARIGGDRRTRDYAHPAGAPNFRFRRRGEKRRRLTGGNIKTFNRRVAGPRGAGFRRGTGTKSKLYLGPQFSPSRGRQRQRSGVRRWLTPFGIQNRRELPQGFNPRRSAWLTARMFERGPYLTGFDWARGSTEFRRPGRPGSGAAG